MTDEQRAALQVVWEQLNGVLSDIEQMPLDYRDKTDLSGTVQDCINRLEQLGVGQ